ncbi:hypothetical protein T492DRAFT_859792 [Pavlovales sp. CCMP2436]|nr:hypothetical protein T492DRAFT_859792 [Pavlovales sp. CCMP2436]
MARRASQCACSQRAPPIFALVGIPTPTHASPAGSDFTVHLCRRPPIALGLALGLRPRPPPLSPTNVTVVAGGNIGSGGGGGACGCGSEGQPS